MLAQSTAAQGTPLVLHSIFLFGGFDDSNFVAAEQIGSFSPDKLIKSKRVDCS